jgi:hypothetical protein
MPLNCYDKNRINYHRTTSSAQAAGYATLTLMRFGADILRHATQAITVPPMMLPGTNTKAPRSHNPKSSANSALDVALVNHILK